VQPCAYDVQMKTLTSNELLNLRLDPRLTEYDLLRNTIFSTVRVFECLQWKESLPKDFPVLASLVGGTGTGKSTIFNSIAGKSLSKVDGCRPCTTEALVYVNEKYFDDMIHCPCLEGQETSRVKVISHSDHTFVEMVMVDSPDFDSVEQSNLSVFESIFVISDIVVFVTSQEKYADLAGREIQDRVLSWGKRSILVINKCDSDTAYNDFLENSMQYFSSSRVVRLQRVSPSPEMLEDLNVDRLFGTLLDRVYSNDQESIRAVEIVNLKKQTISSLKLLLSVLDQSSERIIEADKKIGRILNKVSEELESSMDKVITADLEYSVRERLKTLLRKYDVLFAPRSYLRKGFLAVYEGVSDILGFGSSAKSIPEETKNPLAGELALAGSSTALSPLENAVARLNIAITELLCTNSRFDDLCETARSEVPKLDFETVLSMYNNSFPSVEIFLEDEFKKFKQGLSTWDEIKLYGAYAVWALFLITAEIVIGGGFGLFDMLLNTVILPFIPKWLLNLKISDLLKEIAQKIEKHRKQAFRTILIHQRMLYVDRFAQMLPDKDVVGKLRHEVSLLES
jgi:hypothetical protein